MRIFYPPPRSEKLKIKTPFVGRRGPQARLAKPLGNLEMRFPLRKIKNQYSPLGRRCPHALFAKPSEILKWKFFAPLGRIKNHDPLGRRRRQALFAKPFRNFEMQIFCPTLGKIKNHDPLGRRRRQGGVDIKWNGPLFERHVDLCNSPQGFCGDSGMLRQIAHLLVGRPVEGLFGFKDGGQEIVSV